MGEQEQGSAKEAVSSGTHPSTEEVPSDGLEPTELGRSDETHVLQAHSALVPAPSILSGYDEVEAGLGGRIVKLAEQQQAHDHEVQRSAQEHDQKMESRGQVFAFIVALAGLALGGYLLANDKSLWGALAVFLPLVALVAQFVSRREPTEKRRKSMSSAVPPTIEGSKPDDARSEEEHSTLPPQRALSAPRKPREESGSVGTDVR